MAETHDSDQPIYLVPIGEHLTTCALCLEDHYWLLGEINWRSQCGRYFTKESFQPHNPRISRPGRQATLTITNLHPNPDSIESLSIESWPSDSTDRLIQSINEKIIEWQRTGDPWRHIPFTEKEAILRNYTRIINYGRPHKLSWRRLNRPQRLAAARLWLAGYLGLSNPDLGHLHPEHFRP